jgi:hypothetical protein
MFQNQRMSCFIIVVNTTEKWVIQYCRTNRKQVEVIRLLSYDDETIFRKCFV